MTSPHPDPLSPGVGDDDVPVTLGPREGYAMWAPTYDATGGVMRYATAPFLDEACRDVAGKRVLDLGCGTGRLARLLRSRGASLVVGMDLCGEMLLRARQEAAGDLQLLPLPPGEGRGEGGIAYAQGRAEAIGCRDGRLDLVFSCLALDHVAPAELDRALAEIARVLAPRGRAVITGPHPSFQLYVSQHPAFEAGGRTYRIFSHVHLLEAYFGAARRAGLALADLREPGVTADVVARFPALEPLGGAPLALAMKLEKQ